jgi:nicotinate-nucleotide pyrophosphorylase (carboxylating)
MIDRELVAKALAEDLQGGSDITSIATISKDAIATADFVARKSGVIAGVEMACEVLRQVNLSEISVHLHDGEQISAGSSIITVQGSTRAILQAERTALNFLSHLSGIATLSHQWVEAVAGTGCIIRDTRKTTPGYRELEKYAVRMGGATNHRMSLNDAALIKDNHIAAAGGVVSAFNKVRSEYPNSPIEVEVDDLQQLAEVMALKPDLVLLDNMNPAQCLEAVKLVNGAFPLEASGGISLANARDYAETGVNFLAIGALTHSAPILDIGLDMRAE